MVLSTSQLLKLLKEVEFIIVPVANPDGYYVSHVLRITNLFTKLMFLGLLCMYVQYL